MPAALALALSAAAILFSADSAPLDDTYIHLVFGRNLLSGGFMEFNAGEASTGLTSPLWIIPSALAAMARGDAPIVLMLFSAVIASLAVFASGKAAPLLLLTGPFLFHASSGMETALASLFTVLVITRLITRERPGWIDGILLALASLTRPELAVLCLPVAVKALPKPSRLLACLLPAASALLLWGLWNHLASGSVVPSTFHAKVQNGMPLPGEMASLLQRLLFSASLSIPAAAAGTIALAKKRNPAWACMPLLFSAAMLTQPNPFSQLRYHVPWLVAAMLPAALWLRDTDRKPWRKVLLPAALLLMLPGAAFFARQRFLAAGDVLEMDVRPAMLADSLGTSDQVAAAGDIGALSWFTGMRIIDLDGLVTPERLPGADREEWDWIGERADWLIVFPCQYSGLIEQAGDELDFVAGFGSPSPVICGEDSVTVWRVSRSGRPASRVSTAL